MTLLAEMNLAGSALRRPRQMKHAEVHQPRWVRSQQSHHTAHGFVGTTTLPEMISALAASSWALMSLMAGFDVE